MAKAVPSCEACGDAILDFYFLQADGKNWHQSCLKCCECQCLLSSRCYVKHGARFCKEDYFQRFGEKCIGCQKPITPSELIQKVKVNDVLFSYHVECCTCSECDRSLCGSNNVKMLEGRIVCSGHCGKVIIDEASDDSLSENFTSFDTKADGGDEAIPCSETGQEKILKSEADWFHSCSIEELSIPDSVDYNIPSYGTDDNLSAHELQLEQGDSNETRGKLEPQASVADPSSSGTTNPKKRGPRTTIKPEQLKALKAAFDASPKPTRGKRELLSQETGLSTRVIQVWFQNRRSKERRMTQTNLHPLNGNRHLYENHIQRKVRESPFSRQFFQDNQIRPTSFCKAFSMPPNQVPSYFSSEPPLGQNSSWFRNSEVISANVQGNGDSELHGVTAQCGAAPLSRHREEFSYDPLTSQSRENCFSNNQPLKKHNELMFERFYSTVKSEPSAYWDQS